MMTHLKTQRLTTVVKNLSLSKDEQEKYLKQLGTYPSLDELALEFDDVYKVYLNGDAHPENPVLTSLLKTLNDKLDTMSKTHDDSLWHIDALNNDDWNDVRNLSKATLNHLHLFKLLNTISGF